MGAGLSPLEHKDPEAPISGIPFMVDEDGKQEVKQEGGKN